MTAVFAYLRKWLSWKMVDLADRLVYTTVCTIENVDSGRLCGQQRYGQISWQMFCLDHLTNKACMMMILQEQGRSAKQKHRRIGKGRV